MAWNNANNVNSVHHIFLVAQQTHQIVLSVLQMNLSQVHRRAQNVPLITNMTQATLHHVPHVILDSGAKLDSPNAVRVVIVTCEDIMMLQS